MNIFSIVANLIRFGSDFLIPSRKDILQWELEELRKIREELEKRDATYKIEDDFKTHLMAGLRELELAKMKVECPAVRNLIDEILLFAEEKINKDLRWLLRKDGKDFMRIVEEVLTEEGVMDWESLDESRKRAIKEKIKERLRGGE